MKVIDAKQWPPARPAPILTTCRTCSNVLEIDVDDVLAHTAGRIGDSYDTRENYTCLYVDCPQCDEHISLGEAGCGDRSHWGAYWEAQILARSGMTV